MPTQKLRIVCLSDTHKATPPSSFNLPPGDILIHAGDLTNQGSLPELRKTLSWLCAADFAAKIVVAGNHDLSLDSSYALKHSEGWKVVPEDVEECRKVVREAGGVTYLEHESVVVVVKGVEVRVFGSPYSPDRGRRNWGFQYSGADAEMLWERIPEGTDVLVTHTPPAGFVDGSKHWVEGGCAGLARVVERARPLLHVCGHCHEGRGAEVVRWSGDGLGAPVVTAWQDPGAGNRKQSLLDLTASRDGRGLQAGRETAIVNASIMAKSWGRGSKAFNKPIVVDIDFPVRRGSDAIYDSGGLD